MLAWGRRGRSTGHAGRLGPLEARWGAKSKNAVYPTRRARRRLQALRAAAWRRHERYLIAPGLNSADKSFAVAAPPKNG